MNHHYFRIAFISAFVMSATLAAQQGLVSGGGGSSVSGISVSYSVGQTAYNYSSNATNNVTAGIQQTYEVTVLAVTDVEHLILKVFPNPTSEYLSIQGNEKLRNLQFVLYDSQGKIMQKGKIAEAKNFLNLSEYPQALYLLEITSENAPKQIFKIIKK